MAIIYIEKGAGLHEAIHNAGFRLQQVDGVWQSDNDVAVQGIIDNYDNLPDVKTIKIAELKAEGLSRINVVFPAITTWDDLELVRGQWLSVAPAARQATVEFQSMIDIYQAGRTEVSAISALNTVVEVEAYDVVNTPAWP